MVQSIGGIGASEINTVLLVAGIPLVSWVGKKLIRSVDALNTTVTELGVVLLGVRGQGGLQRRVEQLERASDAWDGQERRRG